MYQSRVKCIAHVTAVIDEPHHTRTTIIFNSVVNVYVVENGTIFFL